jgi:hypothetical protein
MNKRRLLLVVLVMGLSGCSVFAQQRDVYLLIGQSNMAGRGALDEAAKVANPKVFVWNKEMAWAPAVDPLHWDKPAIAAVGPGRAFAEAVLAARPGVEIGLVPAAFGGSSLDEWMPGKPHYVNAVARVKAAVASGGKLRGILWHQGEADSAKTELAESYPERFGVFLAALRKDLDAEDVPFVAGQLGDFVETRKESPFAVRVNEQLASLPGKYKNVGFAEARGLKDLGDQLHFNTEGARELGRRYAAVYLKMAGK